MNIRHLFTCLFFLVTATLTFGQVDVSPAIKTKVDAFITYSNNRDWDKAFELVYPKLFTKVPKQDLVDLMSGMESDGLILRMDNTQITAASAPVQEGNETFVRIAYTTDMTVKIAKGGLYDSPKAMQAIDEQFKSTYGGRSVQLNQDEKLFTIKASKSMMAIDPGNGDWKLVEINMDQPALMEYLFSPAIMDSLVRVE